MAGIPRRRIAAALVVALLLLVRAMPLQGRAGVAEWEVYTPGGHLISDTDSQDPNLVPCLRTDIKPGASRSRILVAGLRRWRYHPDHVVGESKAGYFLMNESTGELIWPSSESEFEKALDDLGQPESRWMTPTDGWREAWFPFVVWRPCRLLLNGPGEASAMGLTAEQGEAMLRSNAGILSEAQCREAMNPRWFSLYRRTTWGRQCKKLEASGERAAPEVAFLESFCRELFAGDR